jgi:hypothetical protein
MAHFICMYFYLAMIQAGSYYQLYCLINSGKLPTYIAFFMLESDINLTRNREMTLPCVRKTIPVKSV